MVYQNLFFDLDNTLWAFSENAGDTFREVYLLNHLDRFFDSFEQFFSIYQKENLNLWRMYEKGDITKEELNYRRFRHPLKVADVGDLSLADEYSDNFFRIIRTKKKLMPHAKEVLDYLYPRYHLYILSNGFRELQSVKMHSAGIDQYFERLVLSDDININKPNHKLFDFALETTNSSLDDSLMIGDNFDVDIAGAHNIGLAQVYYNISGDQNYSFRPTYVIDDLKELMDIL